MTTTRGDRHRVCAFLGGYSRWRSSHGVRMGGTTRSAKGKKAAKVAEPPANESSEEEGPTKRPEAPTPAEEPDAAEAAAATRTRKRALEPTTESEAGGSAEQPTTAQLPEQSSKKNKQGRTQRPEEEAGQLHEDGPPAAEDAPAPAFPDPPGEGAASGAGLGADSGAYPPETAEVNAADFGNEDEEEGDMGYALC